MTKSALFGRRIHIAGSIVDDTSIATTDAVTESREFIQALVKELMKRGANFVVPVDAERVRAADELPICFDWLIWETIANNLATRPSGAPNPLAIAVQHHKNESQIPEQFDNLWQRLRSSDLVKIENAAHWNMASKRMEAQARWGDILIAIGGGEGVLYLANLYHDAGKPVVPLNAKLCPSDTGALRLFNYGLSSSQSSRLFQVEGGLDSHGWVNRINFGSKKTAAEKTSETVALLEALERPKAFAVRLLNPDHADYRDVQDFFDVVVEPVIQGELGFRLVVVDGKQPYDHPRVDQEIFLKLHRSRIVVADITGLRPNCFLELGYALGRSLPTMLTAKEGSAHPFDIHTLSGLHWKTTGTAEEPRRLFREHWEAIRNRPPLVPMEPLIA